jgi:hypothetical protein
MLKVNAEWILETERQYPGFKKTLDYYESLPIPACPRCGSDDCARVTVGVIGRTMALAAATTKVRLVPNGEPGFHCCACEHFFKSATST